MDLGDEWGVLMAFLPRLNPFATVNLLPRFAGGWAYGFVKNMALNLLG